MTATAPIAWLRLEPIGDLAFPRLTLTGSAVASDAFFPFRDGLDEVAKAGATAVIQPGGSVKDEEVIAAADEHKLAIARRDRRPGCFRQSARDRPAGRLSRPAISGWRACPWDRLSIFRSTETCRGSSLPTSHLRGGTRENRDGVWRAGWACLPWRAR
jgi:hypothetical protein